MRRPKSLWEQYEGKARAELLRGNGIWPLQPYSVELEPPWDPFDRRSVSPWDCVINDWEAPWEGSALKQLFSFDPPIHRDGEPLLLPEAPSDDCDDLAAVVIEQFPEDPTTIPKTEQFLLALPSITRPLSFELIGWGPQPEYDTEKLRRILKDRARGERRSVEKAISGWTEPYIRAQFVSHRSDAPALASQLLAHYPNSAVVTKTSLDSDDQPGNRVDERNACAAELALHHVYCQPLRVFGRLDPDPLAVAVAAMEHLDRDQWAMLQVLFTPALAPWPETVSEAVADPYKPRLLFDDLSEKAIREKFAAPLFAVSVRLLASSSHIFRQLEGWAEQFASPPQGLFANKSEWPGEAMPDHERNVFALAVDYRCAYRPGMLLNLHELASLAHPPSESIASERLRRVRTRTRPVQPAGIERGSVVLGDNVHRGQRKVARIPAALRSRHCYIAGASGTGKSTLLLNMILQDIEAGEGVGVLDPHGDLIQAVLRRIPEGRIDDVILFDPADTEFPFALNLLEAKDETERERIVSETVMALERYFPSSWGPRLERIVQFTLYTILDAIPGATLADAERMLTDDRFRHQVVGKTRDPRFQQFWNTEFNFMPKNACDPVLNKLSVFLINRVVRNIVCQRRSAVDFDHVLNRGKIFLANLSTGLLTERIAGMFGSFLVTKLVNAAFRRARVPEQKRRPFYLYIDEFQAFMNTSGVGFERILAEARKYRLVLAGLANQFVAQLNDPVRQAIFGNVGTFVTFRLGVNDAHTVAREMGVFTAEEILSLEMGQAIARAGGSAHTFNIETYPPPPESAAENVRRIVARMRQRYASPRNVVEEAISVASPNPPPPAPPKSKTARKKPPEPFDPSEDEFVR